MTWLSRLFGALGAVCLAGAALAQSSALPRVDTYAAQKALRGGQYPVVYRSGYTTPGDAGSGVFYWSGAASCTDDIYTCVQPNSGAGRWLLASATHFVSLQAGVADPLTVTASTSFVMLGIGNTCKFTPAVNGKVAITITGVAVNNTTGGIWTIRPYLGTGSIPANGAAIPGSGVQPFNAAKAVVTPLAATALPFSFSAILSGLTVGTQHWIDLAYATDAGHTTQVAQLTCTAYETP